nr:hypothetical protein [Tanacetum cinerariifolium]
MEVEVFIGSVPCSASACIAHHDVVAQPVFLAIKDRQHVFDVQVQDRAFGGLFELIAKADIQVLEAHLHQRFDGRGSGVEEAVGEHVVVLLLEAVMQGGFHQRGKDAVGIGGKLLIAVARRDHQPCALDQRPLRGVAQ